MYIHKFMYVCPEIPWFNSIEWKIIYFSSNIVGISVKIHIFIVDI